LNCGIDTTVIVDVFSESADITANYFLI